MTSEEMSAFSEEITTGVMETTNKIAKVTESVVAYDGARKLQSRQP
ncbi:hypothetical protein ABNX05_02510 [Lysinibacillus sp. M3]|uniref:Uncharacterized protein n=1 Tax=Lysinibacillus zambalensis TaxID=3160866 RepID=A0ABV1MLT8_9BACI